MNKQDYNNSMRLESYDLAKFAAQLYELNGKIIWDALCDSDYKNAKRVIAAGCGDSYCAAWAAQEAFRTLTRRQHARYLCHRGLPLLRQPRL